MSSAMAMKRSCLASGATAVLCSLLLVASWSVRAQAQASSSKPASSLATAAATQPAGDEVTIKGALLSTLHLYLDRGGSPMEKERTDDVIPVLYAFDGPPEVKATLEDVLKKFPAEGLNMQQAIGLQDRFDARLKYYLEVKDRKLAGYCSGFGSVTGVVEVRDGKKWIVNAKVTQEDTGRGLSFKYPPECFLTPDKPFVMPDQPPLTLKIDDKLTLKCLPIPPGSFFMGSPYYQSPRYQDEHPREVTLTKLFYLAEIPVTQEMYDAVMEADKDMSLNHGPQFAVEYTPFPYINEFCRILSAKNNVTVRLPTAAEWEYAARVGTSNPNFGAKYADQHSTMGSKNGGGAVKTAKPNAWGLYDMISNGEAAVSDWKAYNRPGKYVDPQGEPLESNWVIYCESVLKPQQAFEGLIMKRRLPGVHKAVGAGGPGGPRPGYHTRYTEDGLDGGNGKGFVGVFRVAVDS